VVARSLTFDDVLSHLCTMCGMTIFKTTLRTKKLLASGVASLAVLAACGGAASFLSKAQDFAMGTWECSSYGQPFTVGVKSDGTALFKGSETVYKLTWSLEGGKLTLNGPQGSDSSAAIGVSDLESGAISHTDTSGEDGRFIGGEDGALSNVKWDFEKRTVSFQSKADGAAGVLGEVVSCNKTSDTVTLTETPNAGE
jgi:hypothetical protein